MKLKPYLLAFSFFIQIISCSENSTEINQKELFLDSLIGEMTLQEKIGQLTLYTSGWSVTGPTMNQNYMEDIRAGRCGNIFNAHTVEYNKKLQKIALEETRLGIPLLFGYDVIHGHKTIFPIPLAEACTWDMELTEKSARFSAMEAAASGLNWTFNPMVDISREPRWGRIAEGTGEDTYLGCLIAAAKVKGYQRDNLKNPLTIAACVKHFAAYGAPQAGRDYHTVDLSERTFREIYLPPYVSAIKAGAATVMTAFNELDGVPATGSKKLMTDLLRNEIGFTGFVVTDYTAINELVPHGYANDEKHAAELALKAGVDMDMQSGAYSKFLTKLVEEDKVSENLINQAVKRVLGLKYDLGLFEDPYLYLDEKREQEILFSKEIMQHALESAERSIVLLKNEPFSGQKLLPISKNIKKIALIGPLAKNQTDVLGSWHAAGDISKVVTVLRGLQKQFPDAAINHEQGAAFTGSDKSGFDKAIQLAKNADLVIMAIGENYQQNGEAASRSQINLPGIQEELVKEIKKTGKPIVALVMAGRPLTINWLSNNISAILYTWHLGTRTGDAIANVLAGEYNPSGKLVCTFPRNVGQIPIFYNMKNTGRPFNAKDKYTSKYLDVPNTPLYPFGFGLSYTNFQYSTISANRETIGFSDTLKVKINITNTGDFKGEETVQLYIRDMVGSVTRPVKELKGFKKVFLKPGESMMLTFAITEKDLRFFNADMKYAAEPGEFKTFIGGNSTDTHHLSFTLVK